MGARSRKRKRSGRRRARRRRDGARPHTAARPPPRRPTRRATPEPRPTTRCAAATPAAARATTRSAPSLVPLAPGERPRVVTLAAVIAFVFAIANAATALTGNDISTASGDPSVATAITTALLLVAGFGMLARQYWAVLGFETILGLQIVFFSLYLIGVQSLVDAIFPLVAIGLLGWLFWKLVRADGAAADAASAAALDRDVARIAAVPPGRPRRSTS